MLILYNTETGEVLDNHGTNSVFPNGVPESDAVYQNTDRLGIDRAAVGLLRLHDVEEHDLVTQVFTHHHHVEDGRLVIDGPLPGLDTDRRTIPADNETPATVTYTDGGKGETEVTFEVNGEPHAVPVDDGRAVLEVVTGAPGDITITVDALPRHRVTVTAKEVG